jgi:uncharacterized protein YjaZ
MPYPKGVSGNPEGRRIEKNTQKNILRELCQRDTHIVYQVMMDMIQNVEDRSSGRSSLIKFHQESAWGKAEQSLKLETTITNPENPTKMTSQELYLGVNGKLEELLKSLYARGALGDYTKRFEKEGINIEPGVKIEPQEKEGAKIEEGGKESGEDRQRKRGKRKK